METLTLSISDLELDEFLCSAHKFFYDVRARRGRCRLAECYSSSHKNFGDVNLVIFEFARAENLELFWGDELARLSLLGELKEPFQSIGERCLLSLSAESQSSGVLYYSIHFGDFIFRMVFGFAFLENGENPIEMTHPVVKYFLEQHANIGMRT